MFATGSLEAMGDQANAGLALLRLCLGTFLAYHGYNKIFGANGLSGTAAWFAGIGFRHPGLQARLAALTEIGSGILFSAGLLTPLAASGMIGIMTVAIVVSHWKVGFFVFRPGQGWEYCATIAVGALSVATIGPGEWSLDHVLGLSTTGWISPLLAFGIGIGVAVVQLRIFHRPPNHTGSEAGSK